MTSISLTLIVESPLHIGSEERANTWADKPLAKQPNGAPYIPATTIKGRLRAELEMLLRGTVLESKLCQPPRPENMCQAGRPAPCPVCKLFGSPLNEGVLFFDDLTLITPYDPIPTSVARTGARMNRCRRVVEDELLFDIELFMPGEELQFAGEIHHYTAPEELIPLYVAARSVTMLGGGRSRGLGWVRIEMEGMPPPEKLSRRWETWISRQAGVSHG